MSKLSDADLEKRPHPISKLIKSLSNFYGFLFLIQIFLFNS